MLAGRSLWALAWRVASTAAMKCQSKDIQTLLRAERCATEKVCEACKGKNWRLKQAKAAAQAEIGQYHLQREKEFKAKEAAALGPHCRTEVEKETQEKTSILQTYFQQNREKVLDNLLAFDCGIQPEIHENYLHVLAFLDALTWIMKLWQS